MIMEIKGSLISGVGAEGSVQFEKEGLNVSRRHEATDSKKVLLSTRLSLDDTVQHHQYPKLGAEGYS
jgi:hypothetical protein